MQTLNFIPLTVAPKGYAGYFKVTESFRMHLEFDSRNAVYIGVRSSSTGDYDEGWSSVLPVLDRSFNLGTDGEEVYVRIRSAAAPKIAEVSSNCTVSNSAQ